MQLFSLGSLAAVAALLLAGGCCTIAGWFCGPDKSRWVSRDFSTPETALDTFLEAIRRDKPVVVHESLSEGAKERYGVRGVVDITIAWARLKREVPGLHLAGNAAVSPPVVEADRRVRYDLRAAGRSFTVRLVEQPLWEIGYVVDDSGEIFHAGRFVDDRTFARMMVLQAAGEPGVTVVVRDPLLPELTPQQVREIRLAHEWKVDEISGLTDL